VRGVVASGPVRVASRIAVTTADASHPIRCGGHASDRSDVGGTCE
jgi:hypothetical protein